MKHEVTTYHTKKLLADSLKKTMKNKAFSKITVTEIINASGVNRKTFYYHFEDISELFRWMLEKRTEQMLRETLADGNTEEALRHFFVMAINAVPYIRRGMDSNHREELEPLLRQYIQRFFTIVAERRNFYAQCSMVEVRTISRYHSLAVFGLLQEWTEQDTENLDQIVHTVYRLIVEGIPPQIKS